MPWVAPDEGDVIAYLGAPTDTEDYGGALAAETAAQLKVCKLPAQVDPTISEPYPADLAEALMRRVAHNLALRSLPLGVQANITDTTVATTFVGGTDAEVRRLERPYRRLVVG